MIDINPMTWFVLVVLELLAAQLFRLEVGSAAIFATVYGGIGIIVLGVCLVLSVRLLRNLQSGHYENPNPVHEHSHDRAVILPRLLQVCLFLVCFAIASRIGSKELWNHEQRYMDALLSTLIAVVGFFPCGYMIGMTLARMSAVIACGTYITEANLLRVLVILEMHKRGKDNSRAALGDDMAAFDANADVFSATWNHLRHKGSDASTHGPSALPNTLPMDAWVVGIEERGGEAEFEEEGV
jgi:hypothetical protein